MKIFTESFGLAQIEYFVSGSSPEIIIHCGTHGDEYQVIESVRKFIKLHESQLPSFVFVPVVSPSAVELKTRRNKNNLDINRIFKPESLEDEVIANRNILKNFKSKLFISFHEDSDAQGFYMYDVPHLESKTIEFFLNNLKDKDVALFTGLDDPELGFNFKNGFSEDVLGGGSYSGDVGDYCLMEKICKQVLIPEIPGNFSQKQKDELVEIVFNQLVIPSFLN